MTSVSNVSDTPGAPADTSDLSALSQDYTTFLKLLTTQLQNQDPLDPMDSSQFTNQLVQFAGVEQQIKANTNLTSLIALQQAGMAQMALSYIGSVVEVDSNELTLVNGEAGFSYTLEGPAAETTITIKDADGHVVRNVSGSTTAGKHQVAWDGTDTGGNQLDGGLYTVTVTTKAADGSEGTAAVTSFGVVHSVSTDASGTTTLSLTEKSIAPGDVLSVQTRLNGDVETIGVTEEPDTPGDDDTETTASA